MRSLSFALLMLAIASASFSANTIKGCGVLDEPGEYVAANDIELVQTNAIDTSYYGTRYGCVFVNASNVTIDLTGHSMSCSSQIGDTTFFTVNEPDVTIKNGMIEKCGSGIGPFSQGLLLAENLTLVNNSMGLNSKRTVNCSFIGNGDALYPSGDVLGSYFFGNEIAVFCLGQCSDAVIKGNMFENNNLGINIYGGKTDIPQNISIDNNVFSGNKNDCNETTWLGEPYFENHCRFYSLKNTTDKNLICIPILFIVMLIAGVALLKLKSTKALPR